MVSQISLVFLLLSIASCAFSQGDDSLDYSTVDDDVDREYASSLNNPSSIFIGEKEIKLNKYFKSAELMNLLDELRKNYTNIVQLYDLGRSAVYNRKIWAVRISGDVQNVPDLRPKFKYVANIHGDETVGYALMVSLIQYMVYSYGVDGRITDMLDIWIFPSLNPDGLFCLIESQTGHCASDIFSSNGKLNMNGVDLDQNFPHGISKNLWPPFLEPETNVMLNIMDRYSFVLSGNLQGGAIVASYPFDYPESPAKDGFASYTPDYKFFWKLAVDYAELNPMMKTGKACNKSFSAGITNGNLWQKKHGSMQDANYNLFNCFEITLHLSCSNYPPAPELPRYWHANLDSMLQFIESTRQGIYGNVTDTYHRPINRAVIKVRGIDKETMVNTQSSLYWRLLAYDQGEVFGIGFNFYVTASAPAAIDQTKIVTLSSNRPYVRLDFQLTRQGVYGHVWDDDKHIVKGAVVRVRKRDGKIIDIKATRKGEYGMILDPGVYEMIAVALGYEKSDILKVNLTEENPALPVNFYLVHRRGVYGEVIDNEGYPLVEAVITAKVDSKSQQIEMDTNGRYWIRLKEHQPVNLTASAPGYVSSWRSLELHHKTPYSEENFALKLRNQQGVYGLVKDEEGNPVAGALIKVDDRVFKVNAGGGFKRKLNLGQHRVRARAPGYKTWKRNVKLTENNSLVELKIVLTKRFGGRWFK